MTALKDKEKRSSGRERGRGREFLNPSFLLIKDIIINTELEMGVSDYQGEVWKSVRDPT